MVQITLDGSLNCVIELTLPGSSSVIELEQLILAIELKPLTLAHLLRPASLMGSSCPCDTSMSQHGYCRGELLQRTGVYQLLWYVAVGRRLSGTRLGLLFGGLGYLRVVVLDGEDAGEPGVMGTLVVEGGSEEHVC
jgi:hypothetical protein